MIKNKTKFLQEKFALHFFHARKRYKIKLVKYLQPSQDKSISSQKQLEKKNIYIYKRHNREGISVVYKKCKDFTYKERS